MPPMTCSLHNGWRMAAAIVPVILIAGCSSHSRPEPAATHEARRPAVLTPDRLGELLRTDHASLPSSPGEVAFVLSPSRDLAMGAAVGLADRATGEELSADATVRTASITKTFTAAAVLRLVEIGSLSLEETLDEAPLSPQLLQLLRADGYRTADITVEQLLRHTSGTADYVGSDQTSPTAYEQAILADPQHSWTREEQVAFAMDHDQPRAAPGGEFHYSDTGYVLLGDLIERATGSSYAAATRVLLGFDRLGMMSTYLESVEPERGGPRSHQYQGTVDIATVSPTIDLYGGGGYVSSMHDLAVFYDALFSGQVLEPDPSRPCSR